MAPAADEAAGVDAPLPGILSMAMGADVEVIDRLFFLRGHRWSKPAPAAGCQPLLEVGILVLVAAMEQVQVVVAQLVFYDPQQFSHPVILQQMGVDLNVVVPQTVAAAGGAQPAVVHGLVNKGAVKSTFRH